jgi:hypothetical protein
MGRGVDVADAVGASDVGAGDAARTPHAVVNKVDAADDRNERRVKRERSIDMRRS